MVKAHGAADRLKESKYEVIKGLCQHGPHLLPLSRQVLTIKMFTFVGANCIGRANLLLQGLCPVVKGISIHKSNWVQGGLMVKTTQGATVVRLKQG